MSTAKPAAISGSVRAEARAEMQGTRSLVIQGELILYGIVDPDSFFGDSIRSLDVMASLTELADQDTIRVRINSPGGSVTEGIAIYNALRAWGKPVEVHIDAMAASIASIIAMAGDKIIMAENASMMIHDPWAVAIGGEEDFLAAAAEIRRQKAILVNIYAQRTGLEPAEIEALMSAETYMSASDAVEKGFADEVLESNLRVAACAPLAKQDLARLLRAPMSPRAEVRPVPGAPAPSFTEKAKMAETNNGGTAPVASPPVAALQPDLDTVRTEARNEAVRLERERTGGILAQARTCKIPADDPFVASLLSGATPIIDARNALIEEFSKRQESREDNPDAGQRPSGIQVVADASDRWAQGAERGLLLRCGLVKPEDSDKGNEFKGLTMVELARSSLDARNIKTGSMDRMAMVGKAFTVRNSNAGMHSTSDFPTIIQNVAYRAVLQGYNEVDETFPLWTGKGTAADFRPIARVDMGLFPALSKIEEGAEYQFATLGDNGTVVQVATYGKMFAITRQAIINDDLQFFDRVPRRMGRAAKRTIGNLVYGVLNGNPTMQDGIALFHASHSNLATVTGAPSVTTLAAGMVAMQNQKDDSGNGTGGGVMPKYVLTPPSLWLPTKVANTSANYPGDAGQIANPIQGMFVPIADSRLTGTAWYLAADPAQNDTIEVTYLDGVEEPFLDQRDGWNVDGTEFKVRMDAGVKALHWRGVYKNAG